MGWLSKIFGEDFTDHYCNNGGVIGGCYYPMDVSFEIIDDIGGAGEGAVDMLAEEGQAVEQAPVMGEGGVTPNSTFAEGGHAPAVGGGRQELLGRAIMITAENPNYAEFKGKTLVITHVATSTDNHKGYDSGMKGQALVDLEVAETKQEVPFSIYENEFKVL